MISPISLIPVISASIAGAIGLFFVWLYIFKNLHKEQLVFGLTALSASLYSIGTAGLYNAQDLITALFWQRIQTISSILFIITFHSFIKLNSNKEILKSKIFPVLAIGLVAIVGQFSIKSFLTWDPTHTKTLLLDFFGSTYVFFKFRPGIISYITLLFIAILYFDIIRMILATRKIKQGYNWQPILLVSLLIILSFINDTLVAIGIYQSIYVLEISYLLLILYFSWRLSSVVFEATKIKVSLERANEELELHHLDLENLVSERTREFQYQAEYFRSLFENSPIAIVTIDNQQRVTNCNSAFETLFGYTLQEAINKDLDYLIASEEVYQDALNLTQSVLNWEKISSTGLRKRKNGSMVNVQISGVPVIVNGKKLGVLGLYQDITDRNKAEKILRESEVRYRSLFEDSPISLWEEDFSQVKIEIDKLRASGVDDFSEYFTSNPDFVKFLMQQIKIININLATVNLFKTESKEKFFTGLDTFVPDDSISIIADEFVALAEGKTSFITEIDQTNFAGEIIHAVLRLSIAPGYDRNWGKVFVSIIDNTERKIYERSLKYLSTHDQLTGLANRSLLFELLNHALANNKRSKKKLAVLFMDLDGFKAINDIFGHAVGDKFLIITAQRLRTCLRESDTIARVGGDEFLIILENLENTQDIEPVVKKILKSVSTPYLLDGRVIQATSSIGVSFHPDHGADPEQLINLADNTMYLAKQKGKNQYQISEIL
jgi:diguanylate cyclase (GGDEF)-like protein/PAS domain S-box-containing protein